MPLRLYSPTSPLVTLVAYRRLGLWRVMDVDTRAEVLATADEQAARHYANAFNLGLRLRAVQIGGDE